MGKNLILISCCDHKDTGGNHIYNRKESILNCFKPNTHELVLNTRERIYSLIKDGKTIDLLRKQGIRRDNEYNKRLKLGPELSLKSFNDYKDGRYTDNYYLPAYRRYGYGRFFGAAGLDTFEEAELFECHTLLVSGLYGLISLQEQIQLYSSYLADDIIPEKDGKDSELPSKLVVSKVKDLWQNGNINLMNRCLLEYVDHHNEKYKDHKIEYVIDLLSESYYQNVFLWDDILYKNLNERGVNVLHRVIIGAREPEFLPDLGMFYKNCIVANNCLPPRLNQIFERSVYNFTLVDSIIFRNRIEPDSFIEDKLVSILTKDIWKKLEKETKNELLLGETLYDLAFTYSSRKLEDPAGRIMHYWTAVECELHKVYHKVPLKCGRWVYGSIGNYIHYLDGRNKRDDKIIGYLKKINETRPTVSHFLQHKRFINWKELDDSRNIILGRDGLMKNLALRK